METLPVQQYEMGLADWRRQGGPRLSITIRPCTEVECGPVLDLWHRAQVTPSVTDTLAAITRIVRDDFALLLVAEAVVAGASAPGKRRRTLVGTVIAGWDGWRGNIHRLAVAPEFRRLGIARLLVSEAERRLAERGAVRVNAWVEEDHAGALAFWKAMEKEGYQVHPHLRRYTKDAKITKTPTPDHLPLP